MMARYGALPVFSRFILICGFFQFIWGAVHTLRGLISFSFFYGFFGGGVAGIVPVACIEMSPSIPHRLDKGRNDIFIGSIRSLVGNPIAGAILNGNQVLTACKLSQGQRYYFQVWQYSSLGSCCKSTGTVKLTTMYEGLVHFGSSAVY